MVKIEKDGQTFCSFVDDARTIPTLKYLMNKYSFQPPIELSYEMLHFGHPSSQTIVMAHAAVTALIEI